MTLSATSTRTIKSFQNSDIITIGGYMMERYPDLKKGESIELEGFRFTLTISSKVSCDGSSLKGQRQTIKPKKKNKIQKKERLLGKSRSFLLK